MTLLLLGLGTKVATAEALDLNVTVQDGAVPVQAPDQPENDASLAGCAVSVTTVPSRCVVVQLPVQVELFPLMSALSVPLPVPDRE